MNSTQKCTNTSEELLFQVHFFSYNFLLAYSERSRLYAEYIVYPTNLPSWRSAISSIGPWIEVKPTKIQLH